MNKEEIQTIVEELKRGKYERNRSISRSIR